ncbi:MAG: thioredoxin-like domain-containing protein [Planctomycetota bacterium]|nr:thioredoxin-like domain-containing protein [Planctomycetota bacterium]
MKRQLSLHLTSCGLTLALLSWGSLAQAASPSAADALKLSPIQKGVDYDTPGAKEVEACKIVAQKNGGTVGWAVEDSAGRLLRVFLDTNGDNTVDQWRYFKNGLEVYRDADSDFNRKADNFRWFHTSGSRWGIDKNEDGKIDSWKAISAEEASAEAVAALSSGDTDRFMLLVLTPEELKSLGLGAAKEKQLGENISRLKSEFEKLSGSKGLPADTQWVQFNASMPGIVPSGTNGSTKDLSVYENVTAFVRNKDKHAEVLIGTLVKVGDAWRMVHAPRSSDSGQSGVAAAEFFSPRVAGGGPAGQAAGGQDQAAQKLLAALEDIDKEITQASDKKKVISLNARRADIVEKIAEGATNSADRAMWVRQLADMVSAASQTGTYPDGAKRLASLFEKCKKGDDKNLAAYVRFRQLTADYGLSLQGEKPDFQKIQEQWLKSLEQFVKDYPSSNDAAEAMLQLAIANEFAGEEDKAKTWYARIVKEFPGASVGKKAAGAGRRLTSEGKLLELSGKTPAGKTVDLDNYRGKAVLVQYWATWCKPAKTAMPTLRELTTKYGGTFQVVGVNLDNRLEDLNTFLEENELPWPQIHESGGLDSRPANEFGILTVPTMVLVDKQGKVVRRNVPLAELDDELKKMLGPASARRSGKNKKVR